MSNEEQFDGHVRRMFQGESVSPPIQLEERVFAQLAPSPWPKRLGLGFGVLFVCFAGWKGMLSEPDKPQLQSPFEAGSEIQGETQGAAFPVVSDGTDGSIDPDMSEGFVVDEPKHSQSDKVNHEAVNWAELSENNTILQNEKAVESLERLPLESISNENAEESKLQESEEQWVLPAVVKLKN